MTEIDMPLIELMQKQDGGDFLRAIAEAVQLLMERAVEGLVGPGPYELGGGSPTWRNGHRDRELMTRLGGAELASRSSGRAPSLRAPSSRAGRPVRRWWR